MQEAPIAGASYITGEKDMEMPTRANRIYKAMMIVGAVNLLLDAVTVFSLVFFEDMPLWFVNGSHRVFIISLD